MTSRTDGRRAKLHRFRYTAVAGLLAAALGLAGCDGENLFGGEKGTVSGGPPRITELTMAEQVAEGQPLPVHVKAVAPRGLTKVTVRYSGAVVGEREFPGGMQTDTAAFDLTIQVPGSALGTSLLVEAFATDQSGQVSEIVSRTVTIQVTSGPTVTATATPQSVTPGQSVQVSVSAQDKLDIQTVGYYLLTASGDTVASGSAPGSGLQHQATFTVAVPGLLGGESLNVIAWATNSAALRGVSSPLALPLVDGVAPDLTFLEPNEGQSYIPGSPIRVRLHLADSATGLAEVRIRGIAFRNFPDTLQNTTPVVRYPEIIVPFPQGPDRPPPADTVLVRNLMPTSDATVEPVYIIAQASDMAGNVRVDTVRVVPGPRVSITSPSGGTTVRVNSNMQVRVEAHDPALGLDSVRLTVSGASTYSRTWAGLGGTRDVREFEELVPIGPVTGMIQITARAWNTVGALGTTPQSVLVTVSEAAAQDTTAPQVLRRFTPPSRVELHDTLRITVQANDGVGSGIRRMGVVVIADPGDGSPAEFFYASSDAFTSPRSGLVEHTFGIRLGEHFSETELSLPRNMSIRAYGYALDDINNCAVGASVEFASLQCSDTMFVGGWDHFHAAGAGAATVVTAVAGHSVRLPGGGRVADAVVDDRNRRVYLSNIENNRVDVFNLGTTSFGTFRRVGSAPWGMTLSIDSTRLYVANSGGTNISSLPVTAGGLGEEIGSERILTPNSVLLDVEFGEVNGRTRYTVTVHDFSDRPQFIAQDTSGTLVYSTVPTPAASDGTIRYVTTVSGVPAVNIMHRGLVTESDNKVALSGVDSVRVVRSTTANDQVVLYGRDRVTGAVVQSAPATLEDAVADLATSANVEMRAGGWDIPAIALSDTTFVASSSDRAWIAFGEGATAPFGRVFICCTRTQVPGEPPILGLSSEISVRDLVNNASERVIGVGLNSNGSLGVARGTLATYFFTGQAGHLGAGELRLQGEFTAGMQNGQGGATLHPAHSEVLESGDEALSFAATSNRSIRIIDSRHFFLRGEIFLRDNVVGPVRAFLPTAAENSGLSAENQIVVKLLAVTEGDNVVVVNVRRKDLQN
ncbi:MAG TPA: Ig-like domain-containing protein [Longimicrobiales bacterium]|nr:Ig-like domain-containing protein [Longimicrobiales bacterium]